MYLTEFNISMCGKYFVRKKEKIMKKNFMSPAEITQIGLLTALLTVAGAIKLPSLLPGLEFQISAPLAVGICFVFGFKRYLIIGILSIMINLAVAK